MPKPLNVYSKTEDALGRALSNFAHTPFELDGVHYASVEGFYTGLKWADPAKRADTATYFGTYAKNAASKARGVTSTVYNGETVALGSREHHALIERAIRAKLEQNPHLMS